MKSLRILPMILACSSLAPAMPQHDKAVRTLLGAFDTKHTRDNFPRRAAALKRTRGLQSEEVTRALISIYRALDLEALPIRRERGDALETRTSLEVARFRKKLDPIDELQDEAWRQLDAMPESVADTMLEELVNHSRGIEQSLSLQLLLAKKSRGFRKVDALRNALRRISENGPRIAFIRVIETLGKRGNMFASWVAKQLERESATVRLEAARTLGKIAARKSVPVLVDQLAKERGRVKEAIVVALGQLTGVSHGRSAEAWKKWLLSLDDPENPPSPSTGTVAVVPPPPEMGTYFTIAQDGTSILYVLDRSDSMERGLRSGGIRIQRARKELADALQALTEETQFNIVAFSIKVRPWENGFQAATKENLRTARKWLFELDLQAGTSSYDAIERAFRLAGSRGIDRFDELDVETLFFLSDGEPTRRTGGAMQPLVRDDPLRILSAVRRWNALGRVKIHSVGMALATASAPVFMQGLAVQNGGRFVAIR